MAAPHNGRRSVGRRRPFPQGYLPTREQSLASTSTEQA